MDFGINAENKALEEIWEVNKKFEKKKKKYKKNYFNFIKLNYYLIQLF